jgi:hypothetical protein
MKRSIKYILSVSLATMCQLSSYLSTDTPLFISLDIHIDDGISDSTDVLDDSIPFMEGVPFDIFSLE